MSGQSRLVKSLFMRPCLPRLIGATTDDQRGRLAAKRDCSTGSPPWVAKLEVWVAADSRISVPGGVSDRRVLTDAAAKVLPMQLHMFRRHEHGPGLFPTYQGQLGFAYAGSTFSATMTYALASSCMLALTGDFGAPLPKLEDLVSLIARIGTQYVVDAAAVFEACILGAQPDERGLSDTQCFHLTYDTTSRAMVFRGVDLEPD